MLSRRAVLAGAGALPLAASARAAGAPADAALVLARDRGGAWSALWLRGGQLQLGQHDFKRALLREAGALVAEYEMKRKTVEPMPGRY